MLSSVVDDGAANVKIVDPHKDGLIDHINRDLSKICIIKITVMNNPDLCFS